MVLSVVTAVFFLSACAGDQPVSTHQATDDALQGVREAEKSVQSPAAASAPGASARPTVTVSGIPVDMDRVLPVLGEAAGAVAVEETAIDLLARRELERSGLTISTADIQAEERALQDALERAGAGGPGTGDLIMQMRRSRGLGPVRYAALLERNAMLRRLVRDECEPTAEQVAQGIEVRYGPRYVVRIIVAATQLEAAEIRGRLAEIPADQRQVAFATQAFERSIDPSRDRGGLLEPISPADVSYAASVRSAVTALPPNELSAVIALDNGFALLLGVRSIAAESQPADAAQRVRAELRSRLERIAMDQLARRLLATSPPTVFDASMNWSWQSRRP
ncbi:MAG: hypothetical protein GIKADHBN_00754 [Phycisphaerales bacterium]|nr:hypothetical protein [Phycisphaerales bacterium]